MLSRIILLTSGVAEKVIAILGALARDLEMEVREFHGQYYETAWMNELSCIATSAPALSGEVATFVANKEHEWTGSSRNRHRIAERLSGRKMCWRLATDAAEALRGLMV